jgi:hypothetical protein
MSEANAYGTGRAGTARKSEDDKKKKKPKDAKKVPLGTGLAANAKKFIITRDQSVMDQVDGKFAIK